MKKSDGHKSEKGTASGAASPQDVVIVQGVTEDRKGLRVLRAREQRIEAGEVRPLKEGQPITNDVVRLHPRKEAPFICDVETTFSPPQSASSQDVSGKSTPPSAKPVSQRSGRTTSAGPAQVASPAYRENWDAIWAKRPLDKGSSGLN